MWKGKTSLAIEEDLFEDTFDKLETIQNRKDHPYEFYEKLGYQIVGEFRMRMAGISQIFGWPNELLENMEVNDL